jgi:hypothetical protein
MNMGTHFKKSFYNFALFSLKDARTLAIYAKRLHFFFLIVRELGPGSSRI